MLILLKNKKIKKTYFLKMYFLVEEMDEQHFHQHKALDLALEELTSAFFGTIIYGSAALVNARANVTAESSAEFKSNT